MRRRLGLVLLLIGLSLGMAAADQVDIYVQRQAYRGGAVLNGGVWWFEINSLAGALGLSHNTITGHPVPPSSFSFTYKGRTFELPVRSQGKYLLIDAQGFVKQLGGTFSYNPTLRRIDIMVPGIPAAGPSPPPAANTPPAPASGQPSVKIGGFGVMVGPTATSGTPYRVHVDLENTTAAPVSIIVKILDGENVVNQQGPVQLPPGKHPAEWQFYAMLGAPQFKAQVVVDNAVVDTRPVDQTVNAPASPAQGSPPTPEPTSTNPPGF
ncbi:MAG: hypothetical protein ACYCW6_30685 [Candidatus Xenobia bacterium]